MKLCRSLTFAVFALGAAVHAAAQIVVTSPAGGEVFPVDGTLTVWWNAPDTMPGLAGYQVEMIQENEQGTVTGWACERLPAAARNCIWQYGRFPRDGVRLVVHAVDASGRSIATGESGVFRIEGWSANSVGVVSNAGVSEEVNRGFVVRNAGRDIWGTADSFTWVYREMHGDFAGKATITDIEGVEAWTKAGVMIRQSLDPGSPHHFVLASKGKGLAYQRRLTQGGTSLHTGLGATALPLRVEFGRLGRRILVSIARPGGAFERVVDTDFTDGPVLVGLPVTSHGSSTIASGSFEHVELDTRPIVTVTSPAAGEVVEANRPYTIRWTALDPNTANGGTAYFSPDEGRTWEFACHRPVDSEGPTGCLWHAPGPPTELGRVKVLVSGFGPQVAEGISGRFTVREASTGPLPAGWASYDVGSVDAIGSARHDSGSGTFTVEGSGADIWGTRDEFHFVSRLSPSASSIGGESGFELTARVTSVENVHRWTKVGLMVRSHRGADAAHASLFVTPTIERGIAFQERRADGETSVHAAGPAITAPVWLKLVVINAGTVGAYYRHSTRDPWTFIANDSVRLDQTTVEAGLVVSSHVDGTLARATFDNVSVRPLLFLLEEDIGAVGVAGRGNPTDVSVTLEGSGADIWGTADAFRYRFTNSGISPRGSVSARVRSIERTHAWAKAGVMVRENRTAGSPHVMLIVSPGRGIAMQYRRTQDGPSANVAIVPGTAPEWLRLTRDGNAIVGEASDDGLTWRAIGRIELALSDFVTAGLVVTSHDNSTLATAVFDDVVLQR